MDGVYSIQIFISNLIGLCYGVPNLVWILCNFKHTVSLIYNYEEFDSFSTVYSQFPDTAKFEVIFTIWKLLWSIDFQFAYTKTKISHLEK